MSQPSMAQAQLDADVEETRYQVHVAAGLETRDQALGEDLASDVRQEASLARIETALAQVQAALHAPVNVAVDIQALAAAVVAKLPAATLTTDAIAAAVSKVFSFKPANIVKQLDLLRPIYRQTTNYGHFGKNGLPWETTNKVAALQAALR